MSQPAAHNQPLPSKEGALFKQLIKFYEDKQHKKAVKTADQILKKFPDHGETLAMKGLTLSNMGADKREEAYELVRRGLKSDLRSHVCWHVYGLLYRQDRDYKEAIKCYLNALRLDADNLQILRDLAGLQIQMRDLPGFAETRQKLLILKSNNRGNWITFAVAQHANKAYDVAAQVIEAYEGTLSEVPPSGEAYEYSELLLYKALIMDEGGKLEDALTLLDGQQDKIKDKLGRLEHRASLLARLGRSQDAIAQYRDLLALNPDHYRWHEGLQSAMGLRSASATPGSPVQVTEEQRAGLQALYKELSALYPHSSACKRIPLDFLQGDDFTAAADAYVRKYLVKGIPSLFRDLRPLYTDTGKAAALQALFDRYLTSLQSAGTFPPLSGAAKNGPADSNGDSNGLSHTPSTSSVSTAGGSEGSPQAVVWVLYYLAQHHDHLGDTTRALALLDQAQAHTPTLTELYTTRSKVLRHAGDLQGAAHAAETARRHDLSDRYLNSVAMKALMRANQVEAADQTASLFVKEGDLPAGLPALYDMQHMTYECAAAAAYGRRKEYGKALKKWHAVLKHFDDMHEDQFDFHSYCVRKTTLRAYVAMLRWEDELFAAPFYVKAAAGAIRTYLALADKPSAAQQEADEEALLASMNPEERKKYKLKKKKEEKAKAKAAEGSAGGAAADGPGTSGKGGEKKKGQGAGSERPKDLDPDGAKLASTADPLGEATKLVVSMKTHAPGHLETHLLAAEVYTRRGRLLLALAGVQHAAKLAGTSHPAVHTALVRVCQAVAAPAAPDAPATHPTVAAIVSEGVAGLLSGAADVAAYNGRWLSQHGASSVAHRVAGARALLALGGPNARKQAADLILSAGPSALGHGGQSSHAACVDAYELLSSPTGIASPEASEQWRATCAAAFPYSRVFGGAQVVPLDPDYAFESMTEAFGRLAF